MYGCNAHGFTQTKRMEIGHHYIGIQSIDFVNHEMDSFTGDTQALGNLFIHRRQPGPRVGHE